MNSDDPVAQDGELFPYVKTNESCAILQGQQKFYSWGDNEAKKSWDKTICRQQRSEFDPLNSDNPVAPNSDLLPYVKANVSCSIRQCQQKFYSLGDNEAMKSWDKTRCCQR